MAFFEIGKPAPEKIHFEVKNSKDRAQQYHDIAELIHGAFYRLFETRELYKIVIDVRLEKVREEPKKGTVESNVITQESIDKAVDEVLGDKTK